MITHPLAGCTSSDKDPERWGSLLQPTAAETWSCESEQALGHSQPDFKSRTARRAGYQLRHGMSEPARPAGLSSNSKQQTRAPPREFRDAPRRLQGSEPQMPTNPSVLKHATTRVTPKEYGKTSAITIAEGGNMMDFNPRAVADENRRSGNARGRAIRGNFAGWEGLPVPPTSSWHERAPKDTLRETARQVVVSERACRQIIHSECPAASAAAGSADSRELTTRVVESVAASSSVKHRRKGKHEGQKPDGQWDVEMRKRNTGHEQERSTGNCTARQRKASRAAEHKVSQVWRRIGVEPVPREGRGTTGVRSVVCDFETCQNIATFGVNGVVRYW